MWDEAEDFQLSDCGAGDEDALCVGAGVWRGDEEAGTLDEGAVVGGEAFEFFSVIEGHAEPYAGVAGFGGETAAEKPLWVGGVARGRVARGRSRPT